MVNNEPNDPAHDLTNYIRYLKRQGILDEQFNHIEEMKQSRNQPFLFSEMIVAYIRDAENCIEEITNTLSRDPIDFPKVKIAAHRLKGCSISFGCIRIVHAAQDLQRASTNKNQEGCFAHFLIMKDEFDLLHQNLTRIAELERFAAGGDI